MLQVQGKDRALVAEAGRKLGLDGTYIALSYIEQASTLTQYFLAQMHPSLEILTDINPVQASG